MTADDRVKTRFGIHNTAYFSLFPGTVRLYVVFGAIRTNGRRTYKKF